MNKGGCLILSGGEQWLFGSCICLIMIATSREYIEA